MKTHAQLITDLKSLVDDPALPNQIATGWLNEGLANLTPVLRLQDRATATITPGRAEYTLPADFFEEWIVRLVAAQRELDRLAAHDWSSPGYKLWGKTIILQPVPTAADMLELWYYRLPRPMVAPTDVPDLPGSSFAHLLVWYAGCLYEVFEKEIALEQASFWPKYLMGKAALDRYMVRLALKLPSRWRVKR